MNKLAFSLLILFVLPLTAFAQSYEQEFFKAEVLEVLEDGEMEFAGHGQDYQLLEVEILEGEEEGEVLTIQHGGQFSLTEAQKMAEGEKIVISKFVESEEYIVIDRYRITPMIWVFLIFLAAATLFGGKKGIMAFVGLAISIMVLAKFVVPQIINGANPLFISLVGTFAIAVLSIYVSHGVNKRTSIALLSTLLSVGIAILFAVLFVEMTHLFGMGSDDAVFLQLGPLQQVNLKGLLLAGIIIGTLGVLDDITTAQAAAVDELKKANPKFKFKELYKRGISVGSEHIASLINTLVLAYAGTSLPLFILFVINETQPFWVILNSEFLAEEVVRTMVGSICLVFAVPITTALAAYFFQKAPSKLADGSHTHCH